MSKFKKIRMVGYGRVSTDEEKQLYSLENQRIFFEEFAEKYNYKLVHVYADEGISGKQLKKRDEFLKMMQDAEYGIFDVVVVKDVSRFARNTVDLLTSIRTLKSIGVNVLFANNNQQTLGESEFVITLLGAMAQEESANLSKRVQFGKNVTAKRGRVPKVILGYDYIDNYTLKINEDEAALVRRIYDLYISGECGMAAIATKLRGEGIRTKLGCAYTEGYIRRVLTNSIYHGDMVNHKTQTTDFINGTRKNLPSENQYHHDRPGLAIISKEIFDKAQRIREERCAMQISNGRDPRRRYTNRYLFSGLVRCGVCGRTMFRHDVPRKGSDKVDSYWRCKNSTMMKHDTRCNNRFYVRDDLLKSGLIDAIHRCIGDKKAFAKEVQQQMQLQADDEKNTEELIASKMALIEKLNKQKQKYIDMYTNDVITMDELKVYTSQIATKSDEVNEELVMLQRGTSALKKASRSIEECINAIEEFLELDDANNAAVRSILSHVVAKPDKTLSFVFKVS